MSINLREMFLNGYLSKCAKSNKFEIHGSAGGLDGCLSVVQWGGRGGQMTVL